MPDQGSTIALNQAKTAIVHEWFVNYAGSERVVEQMLHVSPEAQLHALVDFLKPEERHYIGGRKVNTSFIQGLPFANPKFRTYLPLFPMAIEGLDLRDYDLILSSSHAVAKGVVAAAHQLHITYCHSPMRYAWDLYHQYLSEAGLAKGLKGLLAQRILSKMRIWDFASAQRVHHFVANSHYIARRIKHVYGRQADVIYPPVNTTKFALQERKDNYFLTAARFVPYKKVDLVVEAFANMPQHKLVVVGNGSEAAKIKSLAKGNIEILDHVGGTELVSLMANARAFVFAAEEDFGITLAEAQACGTPVIAYGKGGAAEIVQHGTTGVLFQKQEVSSLVAAVAEFESWRDNMEPNAIRANAERFSEARFRDQWANYVKDAWQNFRQ